MKLRIAGIQYNPLMGQVERNITKIHSLLSSFNRPIDLLVLPELAVTGYNFKTPGEIRPYLETQNGPSFQLAKDLSSRYQCTTIIGYPEDHQGTTYNSALVVNQDGELVYNYRKTHLYSADEAWGCSENPKRDFEAIELPLGKGPSREVIRTSIGICMDLNPYKFEAPFNDFEFSMSAYLNGSRLLVVPTAWLNEVSPDIQDDLLKEQKAERAKEIATQLEENTFENSAKPLGLLINYWIVRLFPFVAHPLNELPKQNKKVTTVICNRTGIEHETLYGGSSSIIQFDRSGADSEQVDALNPSVSILASAGRATEEVIYLEIQI